MNKSDLQSIARGVSLEYLKNGKSLNDSIIEEAQKQTLTNYHIQRISEFSNHMVRRQLFKQKGVNQAEVTFPYADPQAIILSLARPAGNDAIHDDYLAPPGKKYKASNDDPKISKEASVMVIQDGMRKQAALKEANSRVYMKALEYGNAREKFASAMTQFFRRRGSPLDLAKMAQTIDESDVLQRVMNNIEETTPKDVKGAVEELKGIMHPNVSVVRINAQEPVTRTYNYLVTAAKDVREAAIEAKQKELELENYTKAAQAEAAAAPKGGGAMGMLGPAMNAYWAYQEMNDWMDNVKKYEDLYSASPEGKFMAVNQMSQPIGAKPSRHKPKSDMPDFRTSYASLFQRPGDPK